MAKLEGDDPKPHRLKNVRIIETSAVDHPAHLHPGWLLMKSVGSDKADALLAALGKERNMTQIKDMPVLSGLLKSLDGTVDVTGIRKGFLDADETAILKELSEADIAPLRDGLAELWKVARDLADKGNPETPSAENPAPAAAPATPDAASVLASAGLQKAIGSEGVALLKAMSEQAETTRVALEKERDERADERAITKARDAFGDIFDAPGVETFGKSFRKFEAVDPEGAKEVWAALQKSVELNKSAEAIITTEIGKAGTAASGSAEDQLNQIAKGYVESGAEKTFPAAFAKATENNPEIYERLRAEKVS